LKSSKFQGHSIQLFLAPEIRSALIQFMAKNDLGQEYATLLLLVKALYQERLIEKEVYEIYVSRYSRKLVVEQPQKLTVTELQEKQKLDEKTRYFSMVLDQWHIHGPDWHQKKLTEAKEWQNRIPGAKLVLDLGVGQK
jgi:hypothetical protein